MDLLLRNAMLLGKSTPSDIAITGDRITSITATKGKGASATEVIDLEGRLVTGPLVEPHIHMDAVLTVGQPRNNVSGTLFEGIAIWGERVKTLTVDDVIERGREVMTWQLACGVQHVRSHVDVCDPELTALEGLCVVREEMRGVVDLQLVAFPQQGIFGFKGGPGLMRTAVERGADVVGGIPHFELTRDEGVESVKFVFDLAEEAGLQIDIHCDETDDDHSRFVEVMVSETIRRGMSGRVTASHTTAMHSYNNAYANRLITNIQRAGLHMITNPLDSSVLQGRFDSGPIRRGHTRFKEMWAAGVNVSIGHDSVMDPWYPLGYGDPLQAAFVLVHYGHMSGAKEMPYLFEMITTNPAKALGVDSRGIRKGGPADIVVFDAPTPEDALRRVTPRFLVMRDGKIVARTKPSETTVTINGKTRPVTFLRP
ncbi:MAG: cytosine deaminase [Actinobacteria bacterium]|nr:cytosine deaminase [Actinomycetota bacterium]